MDAARKAALKAAYKESRSRAGVIQVRNLKNGKRWVRGTVDVDALMTRIRFQLITGVEAFAKGLQDDWKTYGEESFVFEVLDLVAKIAEKDEAEVTAEVAEMEKLYCEELKPYGDNGYNRPPIK
jgi:hypothetical protein